MSNTAQVSIKDMIEQGYLTRPAVYVPQSQLSGVHTPPRPAEILAYEKYAKGESALCFCINVAHAKAAAAMFSDWGIYSEAYTGEDFPEKRSRKLFDLEKGVIKVLCLVNPLPAVGPYVHCVISLRPTQSRPLWVTQAGHCLQPLYAPGYDLNTIEGRLGAIAAGPKPQAIILDLAGNSLTLGLPDEEIVYFDEGDYSKEDLTKMLQKARAQLNEGYSIQPSKTTTITHKVTASNMIFTQQQGRAVRPVSAPNNKALTALYNEVVIGGTPDPNEYITCPIDWRHHGRSRKPKYPRWLLDHLQKQLEFAYPYLGNNRRAQDARRELYVMAFLNGYDAVRPQLSALNSIDLITSNYKTGDGTKIGRINKILSNAKKQRV